MPAGKESDNAVQRTTFRPPWVKDGPNPLPTPSAPWTLNKANRRDSSTSSDNSSTEYNPLGELIVKFVKEILYCSSTFKNWLFIHNHVGKNQLLPALHVIKYCQCLIID